MVYHKGSGLQEYCDPPNQCQDSSADLHTTESLRFFSTSGDRTDLQVPVPVSDHGLILRQILQTLQKIQADVEYVKEGKIYCKQNDSSSQTA